LDFGLAKALDSGSVRLQPDLTQSPTITTPAMMTGVGMILGTAAYMSPEQAKGRAADKRSDVWAFGCVLYEMLTGKRAFEGEDVGETLAAVIRGEPNWTALPRNLPSPVDKLLRRSLEKDRARRIGDVSTVRFLLGEASAVPPASENARAGAMPTTAKAILAASVAVAAIAITAAAWFALRPLPSPPVHPVTRFSVALPPDVVLSFGNNPNSSPIVALSPDGTRVVYVATRTESSSPQLYQRMSDQLEPVAIPGTERAQNPFFSPDGLWIGFSTSDGKLKKVAIGGGAAFTICDSVPLRGATWLSDGSIIFAPTGAATDFDLWRVSAAGGTPSQIVKRDPKSETALRWPEALPDGKSILFTIQRPNSDYSGATIAAMRLDTGERKVLIEGGTMPHYLASGHLVFTRAGVVMAVPFDLRTLQVTGAPVTMMDGVVATNPVMGAVQLATSITGSAVYIPGRVTENSRTLVWVDRHGGVAPVNVPARNYEYPRLSPDGERLALTISGDGGTALRDVWVYEFSRGVLSRLTFEKEEAESVAWTPDGKHITYAVSRGPTREIRWKSPDGSGTDELLAVNDRHLHLGTWSPNGDALVLQAVSLARNGVDAGSLWLLQMTPKPVLRPFLRTQAEIRSPAVSPDGRWMAYSANDTNRFEIYVQAFPGPGAKYQISTNGGAEPRWARNGRELFYRDGDKMTAVALNSRGEGLQAGPPTELFKGRFASGGPNTEAYYDVSLDAQRFLMIKNSEAQNANALVMIQDWANELKARVPVKP